MDMYPMGLKLSPEESAQQRAEVMLRYGLPESGSYEDLQRKREMSGWLKSKDDLGKYLGIAAAALVVCIVLKKRN